MQLFVIKYNILLDLPSRFLQLKIINNFGSVHAQLTKIANFDSSVRCESLGLRKLSFYAVSEILFWNRFPGKLIRYFLALWI